MASSTTTSPYAEIALEYLYFLSYSEDEAFLSSGLRFILITLDLITTSEGLPPKTSSSSESHFAGLDTIPDSNPEISIDGPSMVNEPIVQIALNSVSDALALLSVILNEPSPVITQSALQTRKPLSYAPYQSVSINILLRSILLLPVTTTFTLPIQFFA